MQLRFPKEPEAWKRCIEATVVRLDGEAQKIWRHSPQIPDPEAGTAFTGPISPTAFQFGGAGAGSSGTEVSGTGGPFSGGSQT